MPNELALFGGTPVLKQPLPPWSWPPRYPDMGQILKDYIDSGQPLSIQGRDGVIAACEDEFKRRLHRRHAVACSSGTMAIYSAFFALGIQPGDEVICPTITYHATATPAMHLGAKIVLVDVEPDTGNIDMEAAEAAISPRTRVIASNAMWGHPVQQQGLRELCDRHRIAWLEDFSHAHFAEFEEKPVGSWGDVACASLQGNKFVSGGEGGLLVTDCDQIHDRAVLLGHNLKRSATCVVNPDYSPIGRSGYGLKLRCHPLAAALILDQLLNHVEQWIVQRRDSLNRLSVELSTLAGIRPPVIRDYVTSMGAWYGYKPWVDWASLGVSRERVVEALQAENLDVEIPGSPPLHTMALFDPDRFPVNRFPKFDNRNRDFPNAESYSAGTLSLPTFTGPPDDAGLDSMIAGFHKVWDNLERLRR
jgi:perosamine synthetase